MLKRSRRYVTECRAGVDEAFATIRALTRRESRPIVDKQGRPV